MKQKGFTLIEFMVLIALISIMATIIMSIMQEKDNQMSDMQQTVNEKINDVADVIREIEVPKHSDNDVRRMLEAQQEAMNVMQAEIVRLNDPSRHQTVVAIQDPNAINPDTEYLYDRNDSDKMKLKRHEDGTLYACNVANQCYKVE